MPSKNQAESKDIHLVSGVNSLLSNSDEATEQVQIAIVGTGFSGLCMAIKLLEAGFNSFVLLEKKSEVGGTWRENTYPGCACDVQSHLYSYSFEGNPEWSKVFSGWQEIQQYILACVEKYQLRQYIRFNFEVESATFDEAAGQWQVCSTAGDMLSSQIFIMGTGPLHVPSIPEIPGLDSFSGEVFHSAQWNHDYDLKGKRVASIGTGGSAIQYIPEVAEQVDQLDVYQRTAAWVLPRNERAYSQLEKWSFRKLPALRKAYRSVLYWINESRLLPILNPKAAGVISKLAKLNIHRQIKNPVLRKQLTPSYKIGCKRILISNKYYPAFNRSNVSLITEGISSIEGNAIIDKDGNRRDVDAIILGTGFHADPRKYMKGFTVTGKNGVTLLEQWRQGAEAYYGMTVNGFPNMFQLVGPNTGLGHNSVIFMIESQVHYIIDCLKKMEVRAAQTIEVRSSAQRRFNDWVQANLKDTVWSSGCVSWYLQGDGRNFTMWPGSTWMYRFRTKNAKPESYIWLTQSDLKVCSEAIKSDLDNREAVAENKESVNSLPG